MEPGSDQRYGEPEQSEEEQTDESAAEKEGGNVQAIGSAPRKTVVEIPEEPHAKTIRKVSH